MMRAPRLLRRHSLSRNIIAATIFLISSLPCTAQYGGIDTSATAQSASQEPTQQPLAIESLESSAESDLKPFGSNLFTGGFSGEKEDGLNPEYIISTGDQVELRVWGATEINETLVVDPKGNIFIPKVGPVAIAGVRNDKLNDHVKTAVRQVYTENVQVYTSLVSSQPVAVFVTGFVRNPGRYAGVASNSILFFIDRAAGIAPDKGSYRHIDILRNGRRISTADLYEFLLSGKLPSIQLQDGDTIFVRPLGGTVAVGGAVRNAASFELAGGAVDGKQLLSWARPLVTATHAMWTGVRNGAPNALYLPLPDVDKRLFGDGDKIDLLSDANYDVITITVEGAYEGQSQFVMSKNARLGELLDMIAVPEYLAAYESISIRRKSIEEQQKKSIEESLLRLESAYLRASSETDEAARIRMVEADLVQKFVARVRQEKPAGRLVLGDVNSAINLRLQEGDIISIPERTETIVVSGEVLIPQAILFNEDMTLEDYISQSGGFTESADPEISLLVRQNGAVVLAKNNTPKPGDQLLVLPKAPSKYLQFATQIVDVMYKVAVSAGVLVNLF